jgi:hypothetical protein
VALAPGGDAEEMSEAVVRHRFARNLMSGVSRDSLGFLLWGAEADVKWRHGRQTAVSWPER